MIRLRNTASLCALAALITLSAGPRAAAGDIVDTAVKAGSFKTLAAALQAGGLVEALKSKGPFTVFAPTDDAFAKLPKGTVESLLEPKNRSKLVAILKYHVVAGKVTSKQVVKLTNANTLNGQRVDIAVKKGKVQVDGATVVAADVEASNGVIHVIDQVIIPSTSDIVDTAVKAGSFKTLAAALGAGGLVETLKGKGPFTVFAPTDEAFAKLPKGTVEYLLKPENKSKLQAVLTYHVVPGRVFSSDLRSGTEAKTVQGASLAIRLDKAGAFINSSRVVSADIDASNGVIHVVDSVLLPPTEKTASTKGSAGIKTASARQLIELAIAHGVPMYNHGDAKGCAAVYEVAAHGLLALGADKMCPTSREQMSSKLVAAARIDNAQKKAWMLRDILDHAHASLASDSE